MKPKVILTAAAIFSATAVVSDASAQSAMHHRPMRRKASRKMVAYDAKDKRYYSVAYARTHGMHDNGGDALTLVPMSSLPKEAKESRAMHGAKM